MVPSKIRRVLGQVKDQTSIGLAKVGNGSTTALDVAIVKATRHEEKPPLEKHLIEITNFTSYSPARVSTCVSMICRRLKKTRSWVVALKTLMLVHRLLSRGATSYDHELFFFTTRRGQRLLDMSDFLDSSVVVDFTVFVRTYARFLDEQLAFRVSGRFSSRGRRLLGGGEERRNGNPSGEMKTEQIFARGRQLQELIERFLACRPTGKAKSHQVVLAALQTLVSESFNIYFHMAEVMAILIDRFMELEITHCMEVLEIFCRAAKQFNEMDSFYTWCKSVGIARSSAYPLVENITPKKLMIMDEFIRDKAALAHAQKVKKREAFEEPEADVKALPAPDCSPPEAVKKGEDCNTQAIQAFDLLDLSEDAEKGEGDDGDRLFMDDLAAPPPTWEAFGGDNEPSDWETVLMQSMNSPSNEKPAVCGGLDMSVLDSLYQQGAMAGWAPFAVAAEQTLFLALPAPPAAGGGVQREDPFATSPAAYRRMWGAEREQQMVEQQLTWRQYVNHGMHGQHASNPIPWVVTQGATRVDR